MITQRNNIEISSLSHTLSKKTGMGEEPQRQMVDTGMGEEPQKQMVDTGMGEEPLKTKIDIYI